MKGFALGLALKQKRKATRKPPIDSLEEAATKHVNYSFNSQCMVATTTGLHGAIALKTVIAEPRRGIGSVRDRDQPAVASIARDWVRHVTRARATHSPAVGAPWQTCFHQKQLSFFLSRQGLTLSVIQSFFLLMSVCLSFLLTLLTLSVCK